MARMLAKACKGHHFAYCNKNCCRDRVFYMHHGRQTKLPRKIQRSREKNALIRELKNL